MYHLQAFMTPNSNWSLPETANRLRERLPDHQVELQGDRITVRHDDWSIHILREAGPHLRDEIDGLLSRLAGVEPAEADAYLASQQRLTIFSDDPDPFMEHFNLYLTIIDVLKSFDGVLVVDPKEPGVM